MKIQPCEERIDRFRWAEWNYRQRMIKQGSWIVATMAVIGIGTLVLAFW